MGDKKISKDQFKDMIEGLLSQLKDTQSGGEPIALQSGSSTVDFNTAVDIRTYTTEKDYASFLESWITTGMTKIIAADYPDTEKLPLLRFMAEDGSPRVTIDVTW